MHYHCASMHYHCVSMFYHCFIHRSDVVWGEIIFATIINVYYTEVLSCIRSFQIELQFEHFSVCGLLGRWCCHKPFCIYSKILNVLNSLDNKLLTPTFSAWTAWACPRGSGGATHEIKRGERKAALQVIFFGGQGLVIISYYEG